jgi:hypothetical protein
MDGEEISEDEVSEISDGDEIGERERWIWTALIEY